MKSLMSSRGTDGAATCPETLSSSFVAGNKMASPLVPCYWKATWQRLRQMRSCKELCDTHLQTLDGTTLSAHSAVLAASSEVYHGHCVRRTSAVSTLQELGDNKILVLGLSGPALKVMLDFVYGIPPVDAGSLAELLRAGEVLGVPGAVAYSRQQLDKANMAGTTGTRAASATNQPGTTGTRAASATNQPGTTGTRAASATNQPGTTGKRAASATNQPGTTGTTGTRAASATNKPGTTGTRAASSTIQNHAPCNKLTGDNQPHKANSTDSIPPTGTRQTQPVTRESVASGVLGVKRSSSLFLDQVVPGQVVPAGGSVTSPVTADPPTNENVKMPEHHDFIMDFSDLTAAVKCPHLKKMADLDDTFGSISPDHISSPSFPETHNIPPDNYSLLTDDSSQSDTNNTNNEINFSMISRNSPLAVSAEPDSIGFASETKDCPKSFNSPSAATSLCDTSRLGDDRMFENRESRNQYVTSNHADVTAGPEANPGPESSSNDLDLCPQPKDQVTLQNFKSDVDNSFNSDIDIVELSCPFSQRREQVNPEDGTAQENSHSQCPFLKSLGSELCDPSSLADLNLSNQSELELAPPGTSVYNQKIMESLHVLSDSQKIVESLDVPDRQATKLPQPTAAIGSSNLYVPTNEIVESSTSWSPTSQSVSDGGSSSAALMYTWSDGKAGKGSGSKKFPGSTSAPAQPSYLPGKASFPPCITSAEIMPMSSSGSGKFNSNRNIPNNPVQVEPLSSSRSPCAVTYNPFSPPVHAVNDVNSQPLNIDTSVSPVTSSDAVFPPRITQNPLHSPITFNTADTYKRRAPSSESERRQDMYSDISDMSQDDCWQAPRKRPRLSADLTQGEVITIQPLESSQLSDTINADLVAQLSLNQRHEYSCLEPECSYVNKNVDYLQSHMYRKHGKGLPDKSCDMCTKTFFSAGQLKGHIKRSHQAQLQALSQPVQCEDCKQMFPNQQKRQIHMLKAHSKGRLFTCEECSFRSPRKKDVQAHIVSQHNRIPSGVQVYLCPHCEYKCTDKSRAEEHQAMHLGQPKFVCTICSKSYTSRRGMRTHLQYHSTERPHRCEMCNASFKVRSKLRDHIKLVHTHVGEKPYECGYCGHRTALRGNCNQHIRKHHAGMEMRIIDHKKDARQSQRTYDYVGLEGAGIKECKDVRKHKWSTVLE